MPGKLVLWFLFLVASVVSSCSVAPKPGTTRMVPTPIGVVEGLTHPVDELSQEELKEEIPVFLVTNRALKEGERGEINPFDTVRSHQEAPHLAIASVGVGDELSSEEIYRETMTDVRKKRTRFRLREIQLGSEFANFDPDIITPGDIKDWRYQHPWLNALRDQLDQDPQRRILIYVHGYNTQLITNTELAAEFHHFRGRKGAVVSFEWPSAGSLLGYSEDKNAANQSVRLFRGMLALLANCSDAKQIDIIAHSAGNPIVVNALRELRLAESVLSPDQLRQKYRINRVILAAPDMDLVVFINAVFDRFYEITDGVAVYASPKDKALRFSTMIFKDSRLGRSIGELRDWEQQAIMEVETIEMIDVSNPESIFAKGAGHSYFHQDPWVSTDIGFFINKITPASRGLVRKEGEVFWEFSENYPQLLRAKKAQ